MKCVTHNHKGVHVRSLALVLSLTTLVGCATVPQPLAKPTDKPSKVDFASQHYPNQTLQCQGEVKGNRGQIAWSSATTPDAIQTIAHYYNQQTNLAKRRTKKDEHLWVVVPKTSNVRRSLSVMTLPKAHHLTLLCKNPVPESAKTAIIVSTFTPKPRPLPDYKHAAP